MATVYDAIIIVLEMRYLFKKLPCLYILQLVHPSFYKTIVSMNIFVRTESLPQSNTYDIFICLSIKYTYFDDNKSVNTILWSNRAEVSGTGAREEFNKQNY